MQQYWYVRNCSLFRKLSAEQLRSLERHARVRTFPRESVIYLPRDACESAFLLAEGRVRICSHTPEGKSATLAFIEPGELFGEIALLRDGPRDEIAQTVLASTIVLLPTDELRQLMEQAPSLTLGISKLMGFRRQRIERRLKSLLFRSNRERMTHLLVELAESYGRRTSQGIQLAIRLSHQDLASIIGATRESVTMVLGQMQAEGLLSVRRQAITIRDLATLADAIGAKRPEIGTISAVESTVREYRGFDANATEK